MALKRITPPDGYPVTLAEVKAHVRTEEFTDDDAALERLISEETDHLDGWQGILGKALKPQTWELSLDQFPCGAIQIPLGPLIEVTSVKYDDEDGNEQTVSPSDFVVDTVVDSGWVVPVVDFTWPRTLDRVNAVRVEFVAGYPDEEDTSSGAASGATITTVPASIRAAIILRVAARYEKRENDAEPENTAAERLQNPHRQLLIG